MMNLLLSLAVLAYPSRRNSSPPQRGEVSAMRF